MDDSEVRKAGPGKAGFTKDCLPAPMDEGWFYER
jgi:hypothetical protein